MKVMRQKVEKLRIEVDYKTNFTKPKTYRFLSEYMGKAD